jgi:DNA-binding Xre family transcriptional regulator
MLHYGDEYKRHFGRRVVMIKLDRKFIKQRQKELGLKTKDIAIVIYGDKPSARVSYSNLINNKMNIISFFAIGVLCTYLQCTANDLFYMIENKSWIKANTNATIKEIKL